MQDTIIARRHNTYRLRAGTVTEVDPGNGPLAQAGIGRPTMERIDVRWDDGARDPLTRRFPMEVQEGSRIYVLDVEGGVSVHPDRPVFIFNSANGHQHREVNAPPVRTRLQMFGDRLPVMLAAVVVGAFASIYSTYSGEMYRDIVIGLSVALGVLLVTWGCLMAFDMKRNGQRAERLEDELSAAKEAVEIMNSDIGAALAQRRTALGAQEGVSS